MPDDGRVAMFALRKSQDRGRTQLDWLESRHSFSFGDYRDPAHMNFGDLRVINEDMIKLAGPPAAPELRMEMIIYVISGPLEHLDSLGNGSIIPGSQVQRMSAGAGIVHAEFNASHDQSLHLLQIWIAASQAVLDSSYEERDIGPGAIANRFARIASPEPLQTEVRLVQDAEIWAARFDRNEEAIHMPAPGRRAWAQVARGGVEIGTLMLIAGDAISVSDEDRVMVRARDRAEILLFHLA